MPERFLILAVIVTAAAVIWLGLRWRSSRVRRHGALDLLRLDPAMPLVLAFSTPECVPCRTQQKPALDELLRRYPDLLEVREVDATVQPQLAERFGIMTVPTTVVVNEHGRVIAINHGVARWERLASQLSLNGAHAPKLR